MQKKWTVAILLLLGIACKKQQLKDCSGAVCPDILIARPLLKFTLTDKITNQDLFFASFPQYQLKDLVVFKNKNITDTLHVPVYIDSLNMPKHFLVFANEDANTFFIQIQNQKLDTIDMLSKPAFTNCCLTSYIFASLKLNGKLICNDCAPSIIVDIKR
jgi:hypothetical protein